MSKFDKIKPQGALDVVNESYKADITKEVKIAKEEEKFVRSYTLTETQLKLLQRKKLDEIGLSLSEIVGKAIEHYCKEK